MASRLSFTGLASGVDTDAIVNALMDVERLPQQRLQTRIDGSATRLAGFQDLRTKLGALRDAASAVRGAGAFTPAPWASSSDTARLTATSGPSAVKASYGVEIQSLARAEVRTQSSALAAAATDDVLHLGAGTAFDVAVTAGDSMAAIADKINAANGDVSASVADGKLRFSARETGTAHAVSVSSDGALAGSLAVSVTLAAADAHLRVDGTDYVRGSNTVTDVIAGTTLNLKATTGPAPLTVDTDPARLDTDAVVARARTLVSAYNSVVDTLRNALDERPVRDPQTTLDSKKGLFFGDTAYQGINDRLRRAVTNPVAGASSSYDQASEIGLSSGASNGSMASDALSGRMVLDEAKLRSALANDPTAVDRLLAGDSDGLATRLSGIVADVTGSSGALGGRIETENRRAADWKASSERLGDRLDLRETLLRTQFTAMERSLSQLHQLQASLPLAGAFSGA